MRTRSRPYAALARVVSLVSLVCAWLGCGDGPSEPPLTDAHVTDASSAHDADRDPTDADIRDADMRDADMRDADMRDADMRDADIRDAETDDTGDAGENDPNVWRRVARRLPVSPLGRVVPISCHNCYSGAGNAVLDVAAASAQLEEAVTHGADLIEIDVIEIDGVLHAAHADVSVVDQRPRFVELLTPAALRTSDSMLVLEIKERDVSAATFAEHLLSAIDANPDYAREGRPLIIKAFDNQLRYLRAIRDALAGHPNIRDHVRLWVLYASRADVGAWQQEIEDEVIAHALDGIEIDYQSDNLQALLGYARPRGLAVGVYTVPGPPFGAISIAALREHVDLITTDYRADQARAIVEANDTLAYWDATDIVEGACSIRSNRSGTTSTTTYGCGSDNASTPASPLVHTFDRGEPLYGSTLDFDATRSCATPLPAIASDVADGFLVSVSLRFDRLTLDEDETQTIVSSARDAGFTLELHRPDNGEAALRFGVHQNGADHYHSYPVAGGTAGLCTRGARDRVSALSEQASYQVTGAYDGVSGVYLLIDQRCAGAEPPTVIGSVSATDPVLVGAYPEGAQRYGGFFDGQLQSVQIIRWRAHTTDSANKSITTER